MDGIKTLKFPHCVSIQQQSYRPFPIQSQSSLSTCSRSTCSRVESRITHLTSWRAGLRQDICAKCPALDEKRRAVAEDWGAPKDLPFTASICRTCDQHLGRALEQEQDAQDLDEADKENVPPRGEKRRQLRLRGGADAPTLGVT